MFGTMCAAKTSRLVSFDFVSSIRAEFPSVRSELALVSCQLFSLGFSLVSVDF